MIEPAPVNTKLRAGSTLDWIAVLQDIPASAPRRLISDPYLLVLNIALYEHDGSFWAEPLWHKDLLLHLDEIDHLALLCPVRQAAPPSDWKACDHPRLRVMSVAPLSHFSALRAPLLAVTIWRAAGTAQIVHVGVAGWPFPLGWITVPIARLRRRFLVIVVESSTWRAAANASFVTRCKGRLFEAINRACVNACDIGFFTTDTYRRELATSARGLTRVAPASWLDSSQVLPIDAEHSVVEPPRLIFAGRLTAAKGVRVLLEAAALSNAPLDIVGTGELAEECRTLAERTGGRVRLIAPVPYGDSFSALLDQYSAIVVPSLSDEQPRILFDAAARALPAIASDRPGHRELVRHGETGWLVAANDPSALAAAMEVALADPQRCRAMGAAALASARSRTHGAMHAERAAEIAAAFRARN